VKHFINLLIAACLVALAATPGAASAAIGPNTVVFETVDSFETVGRTQARIEGIVQGETAPQSFSVFFTTNEAAVRCDRLALMAMNRPGRFLFSFDSASEVSTCRLTSR
jgi:hypothetical protein